MTQALTALVHEAQRTLDMPIQEGARILQICNACRYCEGFCAVFPAMTRRLEFEKADIGYLANLCHGCGACLHACQYAPPHEFAVNVPRTLSAVRTQTYADLAWPRAFSGAYQRHGWLIVLALIVSLFAFLLAASSHGGWVRDDLGGYFYRVFSHGTLVSVFGPVFAFSVAAMAIGAWRFWRGLPDSRLTTPAVSEAVRAGLSLKYLDGDNAGQGEGCAERDDQPTHWRRRFHHATFYGFMLCLMSTTVATGYHYALALPAPYALSSVPKLLGTVGGVLLCVGTLGLAVLKWNRHPLHRDAQSAPMDWGLILALFAVSSSGLLLMCVRMWPTTTAHTPWVLALHLACVLAFFVAMPYGKFVHGIYRGLALLRFSIETREPSRLKLGSE